MGGKGKHGRRQPQPQRCGPKGASKILDTGPHALYLSGEHFAQRRDAMEALGITRVVACGCDAHQGAEDTDVALLLEHDIELVAVFQVDILGRQVAADAHTLKEVAQRHRVDASALGVSVVERL